MVVIIALIPIILFFVILYFTIRLAVRHAIKDSIEEFNYNIKNSVKAGINENEWMKNH